jgi:predicted P-loop ATPase
MEDLTKDQKLPPARPQLNFDMDKQGRFKPTLKNLELALSHPDFTKVCIVFDEFRSEIMLAPIGTQEWRALREEDITQLQLNFEHSGFAPLDRKALRDILWFLARQHCIDSAKVWLNSLRWDGTPRVATFLAAYAGAEDTPYTAAVSRYLWTALAARVYEPGCQADMVPVLIGPQGARKTTVVKSLVPSEEFFLEVDLSEDNDNLSRKMRGRLVGELSELQGLSTRDVESMKTFLSRTREDWVPKYQEFSLQFLRRIVFIGTTNEEEFLLDATGNRRWLPVKVTGLDAEHVIADREQLWAEGAALFSESGVAWRDAEHLARPRHGAHMVRDSWEDKLSEWLEGPDLLADDGSPTSSPTSRGARPFTSAEAIEALGAKVGQTQKSSEMRLSRVLKTMGYEKRQMMVAGNLRHWWVKKEVT